MSETVGAALRAAREQRQLTLAQVSESTKVRIHYLQALESDDISAMPSVAQARGFLRLYAEFLGLDLEKLIPPPTAAMPELPAEPAATEPAGEQEKPRLPKFLAGLRQQIASRLPGRSSAKSVTHLEAEDSEAPPATTPSAAPEPATDKKKQSR